MLLAMSACSFEAQHVRSRRGGGTDDSFDLVKLYTPRQTLLGKKANLRDDELVELLTLEISIVQSAVLH